MLRFDSDYLETAAPEIIARFSKIGEEQNTAYGFDPYSESAALKIAEACGKPNALVKFLVGGTQSNALLIDALLKRYEGVIAATTGHISLHEAGAVEYCGHKVIALPGQEGKLHAASVDQYLLDFYADETHEHMTQPGLIYISQPTEYGTLYTKAELTALRAVCDRFQLKLYLDGARLGYALTSKDADFNLEDIAALCDAFYIGGTKVGALFGEAAVIPDPQLLPHFFTQIKQHGALLAKGWLLGLQFDTLFSDGLYFRLASHANEMAAILKDGLKEKGYTFYIDSPTNQQFIVMENRAMAALAEKVGFGFWEKYDENHTVIRFATSWATKEEDIKKLLSFL
ncbi:MAG TPA: beta-eliminating lyase-related protein [Clostridiales bacterium]|nr:beta-eliminating lyase-related protein [Clostridiales bacterium]